MISSPESLRDLKFISSDAETLTAPTGTRMPLGDVATAAGTWLRVSDDGWKVIDTNSAVSLVTIETSYRPYTLSVMYTTRHAEILSSGAGLATVNQTKQTAGIEYYSFPDTRLTLPMTLQLSEPDTVTETIKATFVEPAAEIGVSGGPINFQRRTVVRSSRSISIPPLPSAP
jgi:hypothetical protein